MKRRICSVIVCFCFLVSLLPTAALADVVNAFAETSTEVQTIRLLDGTITKGNLYQIFGGKDSWPNTTDYRYTLKDQIAWKRVNEEDADNTDLAENLQDGKVYQLQKKTYMFSENLKEWKDIGTFVFQTYYQITVNAKDFPTGGNVLVNGENLTDKGVYEVNKDNDLTLTFGKVSGYDVQVKIGNGAWITVLGDTYSHKADSSTTLSVRYVETAASDLCKLTITVHNPSLGEYAGIETDSVAAGTDIALTVTPYNEMTTPANDLDAYVKSVKVNGTELPESYKNTVFSGTFTVNTNTSLEITFAERLVLNKPTEGPYEKHEGDTAIMMYLATMNMDKKVSQQVEAIEQSILDSTVDKANTPGYEDTTIELKGNLELVGDIYMELDGNALDAAGDKLDWLQSLLGGVTHWGDRTFHNDKEQWEEIRLILPASTDGRYPAVQSEDLTVWVLEARTLLTIEGTAKETTVESEANLDAAIKAAALDQLLATNPGATLEQIGTNNITYQYTKPAFDSLGQNPTNVSVKVSVQSGDFYLESTGSITVPVRKSTMSSVVTVTTEGEGTASYIVNGNTYTFTLTPETGWYVQQLAITKTSIAGNGQSETVMPENMTAVKDGAYSYAYTLEAENGYDYKLVATFCQYTLTTTATSEPFSYYDGLYTDSDALVAALKAKLPLTKSHDSFPAGTLYLEYKANSNTWLAVGAALPDTGCHAFGAQNTETLRYRYVFTSDGFAVCSNETTLTISDGRVATQVKLKANACTMDYADYAQATDKTACLTEKLLDGVYQTENGNRVTDAVVTVSPNYLEAGETTVTLSYAGDAQYMPSSAKATVTLNSQDASITVKVQPTTVVYGTNYTVDIATNPTNLQTISFALGLDLAETSLQKEMVPLNVTILGPAKLRTALDTYAKKADTDGKISAYDVLCGLQLLCDDSEKIQEIGVSEESLEQLAQILSLGAVIPTLDAVISDTFPTNAGFYVVGAIVAEPGYTSAMAVDYLSITPKVVKATLDWEQNIGTSVTWEQLKTQGYMDAKVASVESGTVADARNQLAWIYLGFDEDGDLAVYQKDELKADVYTQVAFLKEWTSNEQYASVPIMREFAVGVDYADVQFVDAANQPTDSYIYTVGDTIEAPVTVDGKTVTEGLTVSSTKIYAKSNSVGVEESKLPSANGLYLLQANYKKTDVDGNVTAAGKDNAVLMISSAIEGFEANDTKVLYDGTEKFLEIQQPAGTTVSYLAFVMDTQRKQVNVLLPDSMDVFGGLKAGAEAIQFEGVLEFLQAYSSEDAQKMALAVLLQQVKADVQNVTGWTVSVNAAKPIEVGSYNVLLMTIGEELYFCNRTLTIEPKSLSDLVITLTPEQFDYDGNAKSPVVQVMDGNTVISSAEYEVQIPKDAVDVGTYKVTVVNKEGSNYKIYGNKEFTIKQVPASVTQEPTANSLTYTGKAQSLIKAGVANGGTMMYRLGETGDFSETIPSATQVGSYSIYYYVKGDKNHSDTAVAVFEVKIEESNEENNNTPSNPTGSYSSHNSGNSYLITVLHPENGVIVAERKAASPGTTVMVTGKPNEGYLLKTLTVTDKTGALLDVIDKGDGKYTFTMPASAVTVMATFQNSALVQNPFVDVLVGSYYYDAVLWAVENTITGGVDASHFAPDTACTRAQIVTFLWRAAGRPEPNTGINPFVDVDTDAYYYQAVLWAVEHGITGGVDAAHFAPDAVCTRAQAVSFLYRTAQMQGDGFTGAWMFRLPFTDVPEWCMEAVAWCYQNQITGGISATLFSPDDACTRGQIVTFLYRANVSK